MSVKPKLFISYSRSQTPFVDRLADRLKESGYPTWLDYQSLVPAKPWRAQIESGIVGADVLLLVVSQQSLQSKYVEDEWKRALELQKRVVLLLLQAVPLPAELATCEWVDFRTQYGQRIRQLMHLLEQPGTVPFPAPQKGFRAPLLFWIALGLSLVLLLSSVPSWWILLIPYILVPLPWQIYKGNYKIFRVMPVLMYMPGIHLVSIALLILAIFGFTVQSFGLSLLWFGCASVTSWVLFALLLTPTMQRRGLPEAAGTRGANPHVIDSRPSRSVEFAIDHADEDGRYAEDLRDELERFGHRLAALDETPEAIFVLISAHKRNTRYDPETQVVYPVILQPVDEIAPPLQRIQWIDFRRGLRNVDKLSILLPEPERLRKALASPPTGNQEIYPLIITVLQYFYLMTGATGASGLLTFILFLSLIIHRGASNGYEALALIAATINLFLLFGSVLLALRALRSRQGGASALYPMIVLTIFQIAIHLSITFIIVISSISSVSRSAELQLWSVAGSAPVLDLTILFLALLIGIPLLVLRWTEFYRWLPRSQNHPVGWLEELFLLYTPRRERALFFHAIFHLMLVAGYLIINMAITTITIGVSPDYSDIDSILVRRPELLILIIAMFFVVPIMLIALVAQRLAKWMSE